VTAADAPDAASRLHYDEVVQASLALLVSPLGLTAEQARPLTGMSVARIELALGELRRRGVAREVNGLWFAGGAA
jgi:hypothetical protein